MYLFFFSMADRRYYLLLAGLPFGPAEETGGASFTSFPRCSAPAWRAHFPLIGLTGIEGTCTVTLSNTKMFPLHYKNNINRAIENSQCRWQHTYALQIVCEDTL